MPPRGTDATPDRRRRDIMLRSVLVIGSLAGASAGAVELTSAPSPAPPPSPLPVSPRPTTPCLLPPAAESNFNAQVKDSGKNAFVKFLAPW